MEIEGESLNAEEIEEIAQTASANAYIEDEMWSMAENAFRGVVVGANTAITGRYYSGLEGSSGSKSGSNFKGQLYNGTRNPDVDFVNGKGKSTLNKHAGKHGYTSPEEYLKDARNFLEKKLQLYNPLYLMKERILDMIQRLMSLV